MKKIILIFVFLISSNLIAQELKSFESIDGTQIFYEDLGKGETIILLSGGPGLNSDYLKELYKVLKNKYRCIILHQRHWKITTQRGKQRNGKYVQIHRRYKRFIQ